MLVVLSLIILIVSLLIGIPVAFSFMITIVYLVFVGGYDPSFLLPYGFSKMNTIVILAIPLFILSGGLINRSQMGDKLVSIIELFVGRIKGGMGAVAIVSCAAFGAVTGSACATLSAIGSVMFPKLEKAGYPTGHSAAIMANASVLGMLIPPSSIMILYAWTGQTSVLACFLSSVIPGIILVILMSLVNMWLLRNNKNLVLGKKLEKKEFKHQLIVRSKKGIPAILMPVLVLGGIYGGFVTPTEAAAVSVIYVLPIGFLVYKELTWKGVRETLIDSSVTTGTIMVMLYIIMILSRIYIMEDLPQLAMSFLFSISKNKYIIFVLINIFMIMVGMLMDDVSAVLLVTPILLPVVKNLGMSPIQFAAIVGVNLGFGNVTPPTAPLLYLSSQLNGAKATETLAVTLYMLVFAWLPTLIMTTYIPILSEWLPKLVLGMKF
jgi:tripartite ATP-independent transporter DctM subunit